MEGLGQPSAITTDPGVPTLSANDPKKLRSDARLVTMLRNAVDAADDDEGWAHLGTVGSHIANQASLDPRNYGYRKLSDLIEATELFEAKRKNQVVYIRDKRKA